jgi:hypothetical protein
MMVESGHCCGYAPLVAVTLLQAGAHLSLEFEPSDLETVRSCIRERFADVTTRAAGIATIVRFGGESFTFQAEWDDPCLISGSERGDELLREVHCWLS